MWLSLADPEGEGVYGFNPPSLEFHDTQGTGTYVDGK